jgi:hypothetical protein
MSPTFHLFLPQMRMSHDATDELTEHFAALHGKGIDRFYVWFADFAPVATLNRFAEVTASFGTTPTARSGEQP